MKHLPLILLVTGAAMQTYDAYSGGALFGPSGSLQMIQSKLPGYQIDGVTPTLGFYVMVVGASWMLLR